MRAQGGGGSISGQRDNPQKGAAEAVADGGALRGIRQEGLVHFQFHAGIGVGGKERAQMRDMAVVGAGIGKIAADAPLGGERTKRGVPGVGPADFEGAGGVVEQADVGVARFAVEFGREAVDGQMEDRAVRGNAKAADFPERGAAEGRIDFAENGGFFCRRKTAGEFAPELRMARRAVEFDQQARGGAEEASAFTKAAADKGGTGLGTQGAGEAGGAGIPAAVGIQGVAGSGRLEERSPARGHRVGGVLAGNQQRRCRIGLAGWLAWAHGGEVADSIDRGWRRGKRRASLVRTAQLRIERIVRIGNCSCARRARRIGTHSGRAHRAQLQEEAWGSDVECGDKANCRGTALDRTAKAVFLLRRTGASLRAFPPHSTIGHREADGSVAAARVSRIEGGRGFGYRECMPWVLAMLIALLAYIYAGYPVLIWGLSRVRGRPVRKGPFAGGAAVLIAAHNEAEGLPRKLRQLLELARREPIREIRIGLDGCTDGSAGVLRVALAAAGEERDEAGAAAPEVRILEYAERRGKAAVLNDLLETAGQPILVLMDVRQRVEEGAISRLLDNFADETVGVVSGELVYESATGGAQKGAQSYWGYEKFIRNCESRFWAVPGATGALYAIRRECCEKIPENTLVDDVLIPMKAVLRGFRCIFEPSARVFDLPTTHFEQEGLRKRRTLAGIWQIGRLEPGIYCIRGNRIWFQWISHKFMRLLTPFLVILTLLAAGWMEFRLGAVTGGVWAWWSVVLWGGLAGLAASGLAYRAGRRIRSRLVGLLGAFWSVNWALVQAAGDAWIGRFEPRWKR